LRYAETRFIEWNGMTEALAQNLLTPTELPPQFPDHTQLPESDGSFVKNFQEHPQSLILTDSIGATLERIHPDGQYVIGQDCGIYWRETEPPEKGAQAPDWFYVPNVPPRLRGEIRRSYVLWREFIAPTIALEFASGDGSQEHDRTPLSDSEESGTTRPGKFWVYEQIMRIPFYGIFFVNSGELEMYELVGGQYQRMTANSREHYSISPMEVEVGVWDGTYQNQTQLWLRWWDVQGNLLLTGSERAIAAEQRAETAEEKAAKLAKRLRELGVNPDSV
jgi:Uma2 family endonuclease